MHDDQALLTYLQEIRTAIQEGNTQPIELIDKIIDAFNQWLMSSSDAKLVPVGLADHDDEALIKRLKELSAYLDSSDPKQLEPTRTVLVKALAALSDWLAS